MLCRVPHRIPHHPTHPHPPCPVCSLHNCGEGTVCCVGTLQAARTWPLHTKHSNSMSARDIAAPCPRHAHCQSNSHAPPTAQARCALLRSTRHRLRATAIQKSRQLRRVERPRREHRPRGAAGVGDHGRRQCALCTIRRPQLGVRTFCVCVRLISGIKHSEQSLWLHGNIITSASAFKQIWHSASSSSSASCEAISGVQAPGRHVPKPPSNPVRLSVSD